MSRKQKHSEAGDSEALQALFDEIASEKPGASALAGKELTQTLDTNGDNDDLQALFDSVSGQCGEHAKSQGEPEPDEMSQDDEERVFRRVGVMTRQVHEALRKLLGEAPLKQAVEAIPDAHQRLHYIVQMTEQAASRVLNATDIAQPLQTRIQSEAVRLRADWDKVFANQVSPDEFKALAYQTRQFLTETEQGCQVTGEQLLEIMMAQDFQDLTGQVIKRVVDLAKTLESELLSLLIEVAPPEKLQVRDEGLLNGPVIDSRGRDDVVTSQEQVDDLLDSLGF